MRFSRIFRKWSLSYLLVSAVAIIIISISAMRYSETLTEELQYINAVQLEITQLQMDGSVGYLREFCNKVSLNKMVSSLRQMDSYEDISRYELYRLVQDLAGEMAANGGSGNCYLYFPKMDLMISNQYYNSSRTFYDVVLSSYGFSYEDWYEIINRDYRLTQVFPLETKEGERLAAWVRPLDSSSQRTRSVNVIMIMRMDEMLRISKWLNQEHDTICIIDRNSRRVVSNTLLEEEFKNMLFEKVEEEHHSGKSWAQFTIGESVVSYISSQYEQWDYVVITQEKEFVRQISDLQKLVIVLILVYLFISAVVIGYAAIRQYRPLRDVVDILTEQEDGQEVRGDAYEYISRSVNQLVNQNRESRNEITRQRNAVSKELLHRLLTESRATGEMDGEILKRYGILIDRNACCILAYRIDQKMELLSEDTSVDAQEMTWFILQNVTEENIAGEGLKSLCFREGKKEQIFLIWSENMDNQDMKEAVKRVLGLSSEFIRAHFEFPYRTAVSEIYQGVLELYQAYQEVRRSFECQELKDFTQKEHENQKSRLYRETKEYVEKHYSDAELSVNFMAERLGVQSAYLSKVFKELNGSKLSQYISGIRLTHAKEMILQGAKLEDIAGSCGFGSQRTFLRSFKQYEGVTPSQFKELEEKRKEEEHT